MDLKTKLKIAGATSILAVSGASLVAPMEGKRNEAYQDIVGVWTICYGETKGIKKGDYKTDEQCTKSLALELADYNKQMNSLIRVKLKPYEEVAYTSFVWNIGISQFKSSTLLKKLNSGDSIGACNELVKWNRAGGFVRKGLINRREAERKICLGHDEAINKQLKQEGLL